MKKISLILAALLLGSAAYAQSPDAVYKLLCQEWKVNADGTSDYHYRHEVQILRNRALTAYADKGETFVVYNPDLEDLTVNEVYTIRPDGSRVEMPQNAFVYQLPSQCTDCGRFNHIRELAMVHTGMEIGCTVVVDYTIHRRYSLINQTLNLVRECPVERYEVKVTVPENQELNVLLSNPEVLTVKPDVEQDAHSLSLKMLNVPQRFVDSYLPADELLYPMIHFYNGVPEFTPAFDNQPCKSARKIVAQLIDSNDPRTNILAILDYVVDYIHLNDIDPAHLGYTHATADEVWQSGCGTATDKAVLLSSLLNDEGYQARVVGENSDEVGVVIDTLEYRLSVRNKAPMTLYGEARDEVKAVTVEETVDAVLDTLVEGFYRLTFAAVKGSPAVRASRLAHVRIAPLQSSACNIKSDVTYRLPKGVKMVGDNIDRSLAYEGVGSVSVSVKQSGSKLRVVRSLTLDQSVVPVSDYARYRELLTLWQGVESVTLKSK